MLVLKSLSQLEIYVELHISWFGHPIFLYLPEPLGMSSAEFHML